MFSNRRLALILVLAAIMALVVLWFISTALLLATI